MKFDAAAVRACLKTFDFETLFREHLGWDAHRATLDVNLPDDHTVTLSAVAEKRGFVAYLCLEIPADRTRRIAIDRKAAQIAHEHFIIYADQDAGRQIWQWVRREPGKPLANREQSFNVTQSGEALIQRLDQIAISLDEEEDISLVDVTRRTRRAFDVEKITKKFYERFQKEHKAFLKFITGIGNAGDHEWYASVMLNRLMFVYFIQKKGFLDGDRDYLRNRLNRLRAEHGSDKFYSFYRYFLLRLFHEGLGGNGHSPELETLIGKVPYLNGGLFDLHKLERPEEYGEAIQIPDDAFERIFDYFDQYQWYLDERPLRADNEINPDVLGYIFEKYINQKQMGAYYTKEDITEYIGKNTLLPFLFDAARAKCKVAFENPGGPTVWDHLQADPDRYIYPAVRYGVDEPLPEEIAAGVNPPTLHDTVGEGPVATLELRKGWNRRALATHALPTETWREVIARRQRYEEIREKLAGGEVREINDLITLNLDIRQFVQDVIERCEGPDLLRAVWRAIEQVSILDPTCGSGAFLFAALNLLQPLYEACLERMEAFVEDLDRSGKKHSPKKFEDFRKVLANVAQHPNCDYFIYKSIILNNLFGVDIMEEAVEICKLRLFLKLAAQVDPQSGEKNQGIEPLPDIDFNIKAGNTLVGYATYQEVKDAITKDKFDFEGAMEVIDQKAADLQLAFDAFRARQIEGDGSVPPEDKQELRRRLEELDEELDRALAGEYGIEPGTLYEYDEWLTSHQPFHWFVEFYGIVHQRGGFDVVIGNPPWKEYSTVKRFYTVRDYHSEPSGNLYAFCIERSTSMLSARGFLSFIVQLPIVSSSRMQTIRDCLRDRSAFIAAITCDDRPGKLFEALQHCRSTIFTVQRRSGKCTNSIWTSGYRRWATSVREDLFQLMSYTNVEDERVQQSQFPKIGTPFHESVLSKVFEGSHDTLGGYSSPQKTDHFAFYQESAQYWVKATLGLPYYAKNGDVGPPAHGRYLCFHDGGRASVASAVMNSSLFYVFYITYGDCFHINDQLVRSIAIPATIVDEPQLRQCNKSLMKDLVKNAEKKTINTRDGNKISYDEYRVGLSKPIIDEIDTILARHYGFTEEELDFIINYDIKYRMGADTLERGMTDAHKYSAARANNGRD